MKHKLLYILALILTIGTLCFILLDKQHAATISTLTQHNVTLTATVDKLTADNTALQTTVESLHAKMSQYKAEADKLSMDKVDRAGERLRYSLTDAERGLVERVVMAESGGESSEGQMLVAQCILNACEIDGIRPAEVVKKYVYAKGRPEPSESVKDAVSAVFDKGETVTDEPIVYFYAPGKVRSKFHESQRFVREVGGHRFFAERQEGEN